MEEGYESLNVYRRHSRCHLAQGVLQAQIRLLKLHSPFLRCDLVSLHNPE